MGVLWNLQALGRGYAALGSISERANTAYGHVLAAQAALAQSDFSTSEQQFAQAATLLRDARQELNTALATSQVVLEFLDVTGTVRSGDELLATGQAVTEAGTHVVRGLAPLQQASLTPDEAADNLSLVGALKITIEEFGQAHAALADAERSLSRVNTMAVPGEIREQVIVLKKTVPTLRTILGAFLDQSQLFLSVLGADHERQYLLLFQNNHELRPTGGFIGSIALVNIDQGIVEDIDVQTVYDPDGQLREFIAPPDPLRTISERWYMRDANWFVDYPLSAQKIAGFFEKEGGPTVDGVMAFTPEVIVELLRVTGPITVPGWDVTVDADNFVVETQSQVTYDYDRELNRPKQFLADLTPVLLNKVFAMEGQDRLRVLGSLATLLQEKHLLLYFRDESEQKQLTRQGWDGALPREQTGFLSVNTANIGGHKSDQFVNQEIDYRTTINDEGIVEALVTIRRTHHGPEEALPVAYPEGENPAYKDNVVYQRVLVPYGAQLLEAHGFSESPTSSAALDELPDDVELTVDSDLAEWQRVQQRHDNGTAIGEEAGYTTFANWLVTKPGATSIAFYRYQLPEKVSLPSLTNPAGQQTVYIAKQPGDTRTEVRVEMRLPRSVRIRHTVPDDGLTQTDERTAIYRGALTSDRMVGVVFEGT